MKTITEVVATQQRPIKVVQFGEGNFLRAFVDAMIDEANQKGVLDHGIAIVKPISFGNLDRFQAQNGLYTVVLRGRQNGETVEEAQVVTAVQKTLCAYESFQDFMALARLDSLQIVVSNTTEAGIVYDETDSFDATPQNSYPAKLTRFLYERYTAFSGAADKGLLILPVELIEANGSKLSDCVFRHIARWKLEEKFATWVREHCLFCNTLVDRIVTGYPKNEAEAICEKLGYVDELLDVGEPFGFWVIESPRYQEVEKLFPLDKAGLPVLFTDNQKPYRERKVRILNGAHTSMVPAAFLSGQNIVRDCMEDAVLRKYLEKTMFSEILPTVPLEEKEVRAFAESVVERFANPFIDHRLLDICLNSVSKWKTRVLPSILDVQKETGTLPECLVFSFATLAMFYQGKMTADGFFGDRNGESYRILDDAPVLEFFASTPHEESIIEKLAKKSEFWGMDLTTIPGFVNTATGWYKKISTDGVIAALKEVAKA